MVSSAVFDSSASEWRYRPPSRSSEADDEMMTTSRNIALWFRSLSLSVSIFSLLYGLRYGPDSFVFVFRITLMFALPVACLYLPLVLTFSKRGRLWAIIGSGTLIGPASLVLWAVIGSIRSDVSIWQSDGIGLGLGAALVCALIVSILTTTCYVAAFKIIRRLMTARA